MKTMKWLVRREFWENKGSLFWAPIVVGAIMVALLGVTVVWGVTSGKILHGEVSTYGAQSEVSEMLKATTPAQRHMVAGVMAGGYLAASAPLFLMLTVVAFFYCLGALHEERRDRSILFWKSLPLSDHSTVLSKVITALLVAPLITIAVATAVSVTLLLILCLTLATQGINVFGMVLSHSSVYLAPFQLLALLPVYALWALPTVGWLLMVSAWAKSKVFLWAVGAPLLAVGTAKWTAYIVGLRLDVAWIMENIVGRILGGLFPGAFFAAGHVDPSTVVDQASKVVNMGQVVTQAYMTLGTPQLLVGVAAGAAMIYAAIRLRRWKDEG